MNRQTSIVDRLIAYWSAQEEGKEDSDPLCRELAQELSGAIPRSLLAILKTDPQGHGEAIEEIIRSQLGLPTGTAGIAYRDLGGPARPAPPPAAAALPALTDSSPLAPVLRPSYRPAAEPELRSHPAEPPRPAPVNGPLVGHQAISGEENVVFTGVSGTVNFQKPPRTTEAKASRPPGLGDLPDPDSPIRILFLGANPADSSPLRLDKEVREIDRSLTSASLGHRFQLHQKWAVRTSELQSHLLRCKPQILHFSGHGSRREGIFLEGEDGTSQPVAGQQLARLLGQFNQNLRCVVLNACYSEEQAYAISQEIDCVVGMSTVVADVAAVRFAAVFYEALAYGQDVRAAFDLCLADVVVGQLGQDSVPRLLTRRRAAETIRFAAPG